MEIEPDILNQLRFDFPSEKLPEIIAQLAAASESDRVRRCIIFASRGHRWYFDFLCTLAKFDYRDVILAAEYPRYGDAHLYDFNKPIPLARRDDPIGKDPAGA